MNTNSVKQLNNEKHGLNLSKSYNWINKVFTSALSESIVDFWEMSVELKLISIGENAGSFTRGSEYFVTRIKLSKQNQVVIKLSRETVQVFLDIVLGYNPSFEFEKITELEAKILTSFNNLIYTNISNFMKTEKELTDEEKNNNTECYLTYYIKDLTENPAKIVISVPSAFLKAEEVFSSNERFGLDDFPTAIADVDISIGSATLLLNEVKHMEKGDIIVLENSNINNMTLKFEGAKKEFKVSPEPSLIMSIDDEDSNDNNGEEKNNRSKNMSENPKNENIWDNIQVDISAEFEKVKITLGEIKQITEGLVLDMGSIYDNKVYLKVEGKTIAEGELVIINDRYGVKIDRMTDASKQPENSDDFEKNSDEETVNDVNEPSLPEDNEVSESEDEQIEETNENNENEFDYKDFDVDDENI